MNKIYLDNGSTSFPKAPGVGKAMANFIENVGVNIGRGGYEEAYSAAEVVLDTREKLCRLKYNATITVSKGLVLLKRVKNKLLRILRVS